MSLGGAGIDYNTALNRSLPAPRKGLHRAGERRDVPGRRETVTRPLTRCRATGGDT